MAKSNLITAFDKNNARALHVAMIDALADVGKEFGVKFSQHGGQLDTLKTVFKISAALAPTKANAKAVAAVEQKEWDDACFLYNLKPEHYGLTVQTNKGPGTLIGFAKSRRKFPIRVKLADGHIILLTAEGVLKQVGGVKASKKPVVDTDDVPAKKSRRSRKVAADDTDEQPKKKRTTGRKPMTAKQKAAFAEKMKAAREAKSGSGKKASKKREAAAPIANKVRGKETAVKLTRAEKRAKAERAEKRAERKARREAATKKAARTARGGAKRKVVKAAPAKAKRRNRMG